ncbi:MAG: flagellar hook-associated protein FlgK [Telluria sp.]|nr:flagellar hook-associated protein FlgK [Telluria sp.]
MAGILEIGKTGLFAAQVGLATTGHNIANANVPGYSRQVVLQAAGQGQDLGNGFIGSGTRVAEIKRFSDPFLNAQVRQAQSSTSSLNAFHAQISQIDNLLADTTSGLAPALQDFFKSVQDVSSYPTSTPSRQALLSNAESLASRFRGIDSRLEEVRAGINGQITSNVTAINSYATQLAQLNQQISMTSNDSGNAPNDLLDARDQLVTELNKHVKASVVAGDNNTVTVSIGNGQPLVVGAKSYELMVSNSPTDPTRAQISYVTNNKLVPLADSTFSGGELGGLFEFRATTLDRTQNSLGRTAIALGMSFNAQHQLGLDQAGAPGEALFKVAAPTVTKNVNNVSTTMTVSAVVTDPGALTQSDYTVRSDGTDYFVIRQSDNKPTKITTVPQTIDGIAFSASGAAVLGDSYTVRPTINGASQFEVLLTDRTKVAAAAALVSEPKVQNTGSGKIAEASYGATYMATGNQLAAPVTLTFSTDATLGKVFAASEATSVTVGATTTAYAAGALIPYAAASGASVAFGSGVSVALSGAPDNGDVFTVRATGAGADDNRNMRALGALQLKNILDGGNTNFQSSYAELVSFIGNKTREVEVNGQAGDALLAQARQAQQEVSGVNLDEEATNLLRYQQAYQAAGKVMQIASTLFDTLLALGR